MAQINASAQNVRTLEQELDARFRAPLMAYFMRRTGNRSDAEDLTQETFVRLIASDTFKSADEANAYVFRVAINLLRDRARSMARWKKIPAFPLDSVGIEEIGRRSAEEIGAERVLIGKENLAEALACLNQLGDRTRNIFVLFRLEGMKQKDIAALYGIGLSTVEKQIMAAVLHLARNFGPMAP